MAGIIDRLAVRHRKWAPGLFGTLRGGGDDGRAARGRTGRFLLLGSAALDLMRQAGESLAGRAVLRPREAYVVHGGADEWPLRDGVTAISLSALVRRLAGAR